ncbi:hypothetical protein JTE90_011454 [Oedothorax gibbosus]|uniref:Alpha-latrotoxin n=1 Tax=Oedothorax gibbosus TaxID=931172 RepID=A0AAV6VDC7_9ARAC|nr:hypothetical protein JTE90_011454 [Oedothorax gibbosus]
MSKSSMWLPDLLNCSDKAKAKFKKKFENYDDASVKEMYLAVFDKIWQVAVSGDVNNLKSLNWYLDYILSAKKEENICDYFSASRSDSASIDNLVILVCKHNHADLLDYLFSEECKILLNLTVKLEVLSLTPMNRDEEQHDAIYYAVRSNNIQLLNILIHKWPNNYFDEHKEELDELLSSAYVELQLKNVILIDEMQGFVENLLINLRFFHSSNSKPIFSIQLINSRIEVLTENIEKLKLSSTCRVDERDVFLLKFIARNIYILKRQLKCTYSTLPWEEIEFCLIAFISLHTTDEGINLIYSSVLNKSKILTYLTQFSCCLNKDFNDIKYFEIKKLAIYPQMQRDAIVKSIATIAPVFDQLYDDYKSIRDVHSLETVKKYIELSLSADSNNKEGQLVIVRTLQVCGEYFKNTVESPKLSSLTCDMLLSLLPGNTRQAIIDLRNSLSHSYSLGKRLEIEENGDMAFFKNVQNDVKKISVAVTEILLKTKIAVIKGFLQRINECDDPEDVKENIAVLCGIKMENIFKEAISLNVSDEITEVENLVKELSNEKSSMTHYETQLLDEIKHIIAIEKNTFQKVKTNYVSIQLHCSSYLKQILKFNVDNKRGMRAIKSETRSILQNLSTEIDSQSLKKIVLNSSKLSSCISSNMDIKRQEKLRKLSFKVFLLLETQLGNVKWLTELRDKLDCEKYPYSSSCEYNNLVKEKEMEHLLSKASSLEETLSKSGFDSNLTYKIGKNSQAVIDMLLLDIMSILEDSNKNLSNNLLFLDENCPVLVGRSLRNHLAHGNALFDILQNKSSVAVAINAKKIISENVIQQKKKIGKLTSNDPLKVKNKCEHELNILDIQVSMFDALVNGSFDGLKRSIKEGADVQARNLHLWTSLHFASQGGNVEIGTFLLDQNLDVNEIDKKGQTPIHIASAFGQEAMVRLLLKNNADVHIKDAYLETALHLAAENGHTGVIKLLLKNNASTNSFDVFDCTPNHYAIIHNHREAVEILLEKQDIDASVMLGGFTSLHMAAENDHLELVNYLIKRNANVNAITHQLETPLHTSSLHGYLEVVKALITAGAQINIKTNEGGTPLIYAVEQNHKEVAELLLDKGAEVNAVDNLNFTPLNFAASNGNIGIIELLLERKGDINHKTKHGITPLYLAAQNGHLKTVQFLLKKNASFQDEDQNGYSVLHIASCNGHTDIVKLLIEAGAKVNANNFLQRTPLHLASVYNKLEVVKTLIHQGADIECKDKYGSTAIHLSCQWEHQSIVEHLILNGANINAKNKIITTPLFIAIASGNVSIVRLLIKAGADVNFVTDFGVTALHMSSLTGNLEILDLFLQCKLKVNVKCSQGLTPLHLAVQSNNRKMVRKLINSGANINATVISGVKLYATIIREANLDATDDPTFLSYTPLHFAVRHNYKEIVIDLLKLGADTSIGYPLLDSICCNLSDISQILINSDKCNINSKEKISGTTALHFAAVQGQEKIVNTLLIKGADINATNIKKMTALHLAASEGHNDVVKALLKHKAKLNVRTTDVCTPLYCAAMFDHPKVVETLLKGGANPNLFDLENSTVLEMSVSENKLRIVKILLKHGTFNVNAKGNGDFTLLHIAAQGGALEITKLLVDNSADMHAKNRSGTKPIHLAAREGHLNIVKFYLEKKMKLDDLGAFRLSLLHYAVFINKPSQMKVVKYLINKKININLSDKSGIKPLHLAASFGCCDTICILIDNGAHFNALIPNTNGSYSALKIAQMNNHTQAAKLLAVTEKLFDAVKQNNISETKKNIKEGALLNAKSVAEVTPLHFACWKGYTDIVKILLENKACPNVEGKNGFTPLHYACKFSHLSIVKLLLLHKARFNLLSNKKTPLDFATLPEITKLLSFILESFTSVQNGDTEVISKLNSIKDKDFLKIVMNARNKDNKTLVLAGIHSNFPKINKLKQVLQDDMAIAVKVAHGLCSQERYEKALVLFKSVFEARKDLLGMDHPDTLTMQLEIGETLCKQQKYKEALNVCEAVCQKQKEVLGEQNADTLKTKGLIALILHRQGKNAEALALYKDLVPKLIELLGPHQSDVLDMKSEMALVLCDLCNFEEALALNNETLKILAKLHGLNHPKTLDVQNNTAMVLLKQGKEAKALKLFKTVYEARKKVLGPNHSDTLTTSQWIELITTLMKRFGNVDAINLTFGPQINALLEGRGLDTSDSQSNSANILLKFSTK